jgi:hypothetical protein
MKTFQKVIAVQWLPFWYGDKQASFDFPRACNDRFVELGRSFNLVLMGSR